MNKKFYGWWVAAASFITFGLAVGLPYYNLGFFYNYYTKPIAQGGFGWSRADAVLGFPLAALFTLWVGPMLIHRFSPKILILIGTALTFLAFTGFAYMPGSLMFYYSLFFVYTVGYILSGPIPHQVIVSQWFRKKRGTAMGMVYVGVGLFGSAGSLLVNYVANHYGFHVALQVLGACVLLGLAHRALGLKNKPADVGQFPDGDTAPTADQKIEQKSFGFLLRQPAFWLLTVGSFCSIGSIGASLHYLRIAVESVPLRVARTTARTSGRIATFSIWMKVVILHLSAESPPIISVRRANCGVIPHIVGTACRKPVIDGGSTDCARH